MMSAAVVRNHSSRSHDHKRGVNRLPDESNSPPTGGRVCRTHIQARFAMRQTCQLRYPRCRRRTPIHANRARSPGTGREKARCIGRCAGCSCGRDSAARLGYRAHHWQAYSRTHAAACEDAVGRHLGGLAEPLDEMVEADGAHWSAALRDEDVSLVRVLPAELAQGTNLIAPDWMDGWRTLLGPTDMHPALV